MTFNPDIHHRRSIRLKEYDYSLTGAYFVTICVKDRECLFGKIVNSDMVLNDAGRILETLWGEVSMRFTNVDTDVFMIMPNHFHGIIIIGAQPEKVNHVSTVGAGLGPPPGLRPPATNYPFHQHENDVKNANRVTIKGAASRAPTLGAIICAFKSISAIQVNRLLMRTGMPLWQRNYFERIIRNKAELTSIREYIIGNPSRWVEDPENQETSRKL